MDNEKDALLFKLLPCPKCGKQITVDDVQDLKDYGGGYGILHDCPGGAGKGFYCYGWNVRMTVQNWNNCIREWTT